jgi:hypothetical protein
VAHDDEGSLALFGDMKMNAVRLYDAMSDSALALPVNSIEGEGGFGCYCPEPAMNSRRRIE